MEDCVPVPTLLLYQVLKQEHDRVKATNRHSDGISSILTSNRITDEAQLYPDKWSRTASMASHASPQRQQEEIERLRRQQDDEAGARRKLEMKVNEFQHTSDVSYCPLEPQTHTGTDIFRAPTNYVASGSPSEAGLSTFQASPSTSSSGAVQGNSPSPTHSNSEWIDSENEEPAREKHRSKCENEEGPKQHRN
ncbi:hypothetical protein BU15DRAFT_66504 [Melanogaster broomeanus]|nr:hypothetical protein BU15DRAFT_66504 [Melanogaster broomeanus]